MRQRRLDNGKGIFLLWLNWVTGSGALVLLIILSLWIKPNALPIVALAMQLLFFVLIKRNRDARIPVCYILPFVVSRVLFWTAVVMVIVNLLYSRWLVEHVFDLERINFGIPFISQLIVGSAAVVISAWAMLRRRSLSFCLDCKMSHGTPAERGFLGHLFTQEGQYQVRLLFAIAMLCTGIGWIYYAVMYVNVSFSAHDRFVFVWFQAIVWFMSVIYTGLRYLGLWGYYCQNVEGSSERRGAYTELRYIMVWGNYICLRAPESEPDKIETSNLKFDIPVSAILSKRDNVSEYEAMSLFADRTGLRHPEVKFMYANTGGNVDCNIFHYLCFLTDEQQEQFIEAHPDCDWCSLHEIQKMINSHLCNPLFSAEIIRLHTIAMAWKTYDINGNRRYAIKHYRPTFHISDIKKWDVDYNDSRWLYVANNNADVPFFHLRRIWRKYINGIGR